MHVHRRNYFVLVSFKMLGVTIDALLLTNFTYLREQWKAALLQGVQ